MATCACAPPVVGLTPTPGMKWSTVLVVASIGTRDGALQWMPSDDTIMTMSFSAQLLRKRQSCQTTKTLPVLSTAADGSGPERMPPFSKWSKIDAAATVLLQLLPPFVDVNERM